MDDRPEQPSDGHVMIQIVATGWHGAPEFIELSPSELLKKFVEHTPVELFEWIESGGGKVSLCIAVPDEAKGFVSRIRVWTSGQWMAKGARRKHRKGEHARRRVGTETETV